MDEREIRELLADVRAGRLGRRAFVVIMVGLGVGEVLARRLLSGADVAQAQPRA